MAVAALSPPSSQQRVTALPSLHPSLYNDILLSVILFSCLIYSDFSVRFYRVVLFVNGRLKYSCPMAFECKDHAVQNI
jgi:hypothetical protein